MSCQTRDDARVNSGSQVLTPRVLCKLFSHATNNRLVSYFLQELIKNGIPIKNGDMQYSRMAKLAYNTMKEDIQEIQGSDGHVERILQARSQFLTFVLYSELLCPRADLSFPGDVKAQDIKLLLTESLLRSLNSWYRSAEFLIQNLPQSNIYEVFSFLRSQAEACALCGAMYSMLLMEYQRRAFETSLVKSEINTILGEAISLTNYLKQEKLEVLIDRSNKLVPGAGICAHILKESAISLVSSVKSSAPLDSEERIQEEINRVNAIFRSVSTDTFASVNMIIQRIDSHLEEIHPPLASKSSHHEQGGEALEPEPVHPQVQDLSDIGPERSSSTSREHDQGGEVAVDRPTTQSAAHPAVMLPGQTSGDGELLQEAAEKRTNKGTGKLQIYIEEHPSQADSGLHHGSSKSRDFKDFTEASHRSVRSEEWRLHDLERKREMPMLRPIVLSSHHPNRAARHDRVQAGVGLKQQMRGIEIDIHVLRTQLNMLERRPLSVMKLASGKVVCLVLFLFPSCIQQEDIVAKDHLLSLNFLNNHGLAGNRFPAVSARDDLKDRSPKKLLALSEYGKTPVSSPMLANRPLSPFADGFKRSSSPLGFPPLSPFAKQISPFGEPLLHKASPKFARNNGTKELELRSFLRSRDPQGRLVKDGSVLLASFQDDLKKGTDDSEHNAAVKIQSYWRRVKQRMAFHASVRLTTSIQAISKFLSMKQSEINLIFRRVNDVELITKKLDEEMARTSEALAEMEMHEQLECEKADRKAEQELRELEDAERLAKQGALEAEAAQSRMERERDEMLLWKAKVDRYQASYEATKKELGIKDDDDEFLRQNHQFVLREKKQWVNIKSRYEREKETFEASYHLLMQQREANDHAMLKAARERVEWQEARQEALREREEIARFYRLRFFVNPRTSIKERFRAIAKTSVDCPRYLHAFTKKNGETCFTGMLYADKDNTYSGEFTVIQAMAESDVAEAFRSHQAEKGTLTVAGASKALSRLGRKFDAQEVEKLASKFSQSPNELTMQEFRSFCSHLVGLEVPHGLGVERFADGSKYEGEIYEDKRSGVGMYSTSDNFWYLGGWQQGVRHGRGLEGKVMSGGVLVPVAFIQCCKGRRTKIERFDPKKPHHRSSIRAMSMIVEMARKRATKAQREVIQEAHRSERRRTGHKYSTEFIQKLASCKSEYENFVWEI
eukprot:759880-Hanusia_phi.AAC.2